MKFTQKDQDAVNAIRALSVDMITNAHSGHPGFPLDAAPMMYLLYKNHLKVNPKDPYWINRDRFILSPGHGSSMLYATLHLAGYDISMHDLRDFRKLGSKTPGHPELGIPGVDAATGPLGQGFGMSVGMAMAEKHLSSLYNKEHCPIINNKVYTIVSDGDLMEGISHESASLAGHLKLNNLVVLFDSNNVTLDSSASKELSDNAGERFEAYGWNYLRVDDGNNLDELENALQVADDEENRPTFIEVKTVLGYGSPHANQHTVHGNPLTTDEVKETKEKLGWSHGPFEIPDNIYSTFSTIVKDGSREESNWKSVVAEYKNNYPVLSKRLFDNFENKAKVNDSDLNIEITDNEATRATMHKLLQATKKSSLEFWGGSADLSSSNKTYFENDDGFSDETPSNLNIFYGVREFAQAAAVNGITLYGGTKTFGSTFFVFSDYMRGAMRLAALQKIPSMFIFSHDSVALGQDGPTHQPIEQLDSLRAMPDMLVFRPADALEMVASWKFALNQNDRPVTFALSRQSLPTLRKYSDNIFKGVEKGGYILSCSQKDISDGIILATGSEVSLALDVQEILLKKNIDVSVVSIPSFELFNEQSNEYKESVLPSEVVNRMSIEMGSTQSWGQYTGLNGINIGINHFGASGDADLIMKDLGFDKNKIAQKYVEHFE
ncbi:transketolase [Companilactobacillus alimentarius]|uniref:Transketolase n=1 Tax=Companilactobacillus alimentarius DSM 20249 TaxID=1423720 RepID=A0A2K9HHS8_9LACO|nr:transketolase [Companilactobacillus alimentarius]AUI72089.1 transketolase [Companilactobacillus alimentarius DSM 20249]KRK78046.1 transketolase [Companilactobacillus alimentarius DSM 20249]MDT6952626.1 transketolase [Companilactobacillus alimentarius]GEO44864.1 transketolase [Companilactobacillus alimentarius]